MYHEVKRCWFPLILFYGSLSRPLDFKLPLPWTQHHELEQLSTVFKIGKKAHLKLWYMMIMSKLSTKKYQRAKVLEICITLHKNLELVQLTGERNPRQDSETQMEI